MNRAFPKGLQISGNIPAEESERRGRMVRELRAAASINLSQAIRLIECFGDPMKAIEYLCLPLPERKQIAEQFYPLPERKPKASLFDETYDNLRKDCLNNRHLLFEGDRLYLY